MTRFTVLKNESGPITLITDRVGDDGVSASFMMHMAADITLVEFLERNWPFINTQLDDMERRFRTGDGRPPMWR